MVDGRDIAFVPGLTDSHIHPLMGTIRTQGADLFDATSLDDIRRRLLAEREQRVERANGTGEQRSAPAGELALDPVDIDAVRDDEPGIMIEGSDEPVEQKRNLAGVCRANHERETHQPMVILASDSLSYAVDSS